MCAGRSSVREGYDRWAAVYDHDENVMVALEEPIVRRAAGDVRGLAALDLGCGTGRHALWLAQRGADVTALDFSEGMLAQAQRKSGAERVKFIVHDLHDPLPFEAARFDLVVSGLVLEHLSGFDRFFAEVRRVLKPNGRAVVSAMHPAMFLCGVQSRFTDPQTGAVVMPGSTAHSIGDVVRSIRRADLVITEMTEHGPDDALIARVPRAEKYSGRPMLLVLRLTAGTTGRRPSW